MTYYRGHEGNPDQDRGEGNKLGVNYLEGKIKDAPEVKELARIVDKKLFESGTSMTKFAAQIGITASALSYFLGGKRGLSLSAVFKIAKALEIDLGKIQRKCK